jgi:D-glycero-D-manno-heptose 1,7-bisphosphate phosphatase
MGISVIEKKAVFIDRDGVINLPNIINGKSYPPSDVSELEIYPDVLVSSTNLKSLGYLLIVVTNQPDVSRGKTSKKSVEQINNAIFKLLPLDEIKICYHDDEHSCNCRKPLPGMLTSAALDYGINLKKSFMIGDRWKDIDAGHNAGCKTIMVKTNCVEREPNNAPDITVKSFKEAADWIIYQTFN